MMYTRVQPGDLETRRAKHHCSNFPRSYVRVHELWFSFISVFEKWWLSVQTVKRDKDERQMFPPSECAS